MTTQASTVRELPDALRGAEEFGARLAGRRPAVFLDYDGVLTPIVDRPEDAVMSADMREAVQALAQRCVVCVVSGRDRPVVQQLMGHCCVRRWEARAGCADASSLLSDARAAVQLRWIPVPAGCDLGGSALVPALRAFLP